MDEVLIIGAGPAGLATALQLQRYHITPRLFEDGRPGGLLWNANRVENYPGFPTGVPGGKLASRFVKAIGDLPITPECVTELSWDGSLFNARTAAGDYPGRIAVIASGTQPRPLSGFVIPDELRQRVFYEVADLLDLQGKQIVVVGAGDAAFDYALNLSRKNFVIIVNRSEQVKCLPLLWERAQACGTIDYRPDTAILRLNSPAEGGMTVECSSPSGALAFQAELLIGAIGREPRLEFVSASVSERSADLENRGILHYIGDVKNGIFRQAAIAVGDGIRAGMRIHQVLEENAHESDCFDR